MNLADHMDAIETRRPTRPSTRRGAKPRGQVDWRSLPTSQPADGGLWVDWDNVELVSGNLSWPLHGRMPASINRRLPWIS